MIDWFKNLDPLAQAFLATMFTWGMTALGASAVFFFKEVNRKVLDTMLGFAGGVMIAASYWSLLAPAIEMSEEMGVQPWLPPAIGFMLGGAVLYIMDKILPHLHIGYPQEKAEGVETTWHRTTLVVLAITLHNAPEGLAVGVASNSHTCWGHGLGYRNWYSKFSRGFCSCYASKKNGSFSI